jgi:hypothetical protein
MDNNDSSENIKSTKNTLSLLFLPMVVFVAIFAGISSNDLYLDKTGENKKSLKFFLIGLWGLIAVIFLVQGFFIFEIIPMTRLSKFLGINASSPITLIAIPFVFIMLKMLANWILVFYYSLKEKRKSTDEKENSKTTTTNELTSTPFGKAVVSYFRLGFSAILWFACTLFVVGILVPFVLLLNVGLYASTHEFELVAINIYLGFIIGVKVVLVIFLEILKKYTSRLNRKSAN